MMLTHRDEWVVYLDGPRAFFAKEMDAIRWAFKTLGSDSGFCVSQVAPIVPIYIPHWKFSS